jgi:uncharacterized protein (DUF58 family)
VDGEADRRWMVVGAVFVGVLAVAWGASLGVRPALAYGVAHLGLLLALWLYPRLVLRRVVLARHMPASACEEDVVKVAFDLENHAPLPLFCPEVQDRFVPDKVPLRHAHVHPWLPGRTAARVTYDGRCFTRRGEYEVGPATLRVRCPTGLFQATAAAIAGAPLVVYPALEALPSLPRSGTSRAPSAAGASLREQGEGGLILGVREYRAGDALRRVHWPTTARRGRLSIIEEERQVARGVALFIDLSRLTLRGLGRQSSLEVAVRTAAAVAAHYVDHGDRVALHAQGAAPVHVPMAGGRAQLARVLDVLARVRPDGDVPLAEVVRARAHLLEPGQLAWLVVADLDGDGPGCVEVLAGLRARGCRAAAVLLDPASFPRLHGGPRAQTGLDRAADAFLAEGATVYALQAGDALAARLAAPYAGRRQVRITREMLA